MRGRAHGLKDRWRMNKTAYFVAVKEKGRKSKADSVARIR